MSLSLYKRIRRALRPDLTAIVYVDFGWWQFTVQDKDGHTVERSKRFTTLEQAEAAAMQAVKGDQWAQ